MAEYSCCGHKSQQGLAKTRSFQDGGKIDQRETDPKMYYNEH